MYSATLYIKTVKVEREGLYNTKSLSILDMDVLLCSWVFIAKFILLKLCEQCSYSAYLGLVL